MNDNLTEPQNPRNRLSPSITLQFNPMSSRSASPPQSPSGLRWRLGCLVALASLLFVLGWLGAVVYLGLALQSNLQALEALSQRPLDQVDFHQAGQTLHQARANSASLRRLASPLLVITPALKWLPRYGRDLSAARPLLDLAADLTLSADEVFIAFEPLLNGLTASTSEGPFSLLAKTLPTATPHVHAASQALKRVESLQSQLNSADLSPEIQTRLDRLNHYLPFAHDGLELAQALPELAGLEAPQSYLLLVQNQDELRPTGGFIGGAGILTVSHGRIEEFYLIDSAAVDDFTKGPYPAPPAPLRRYMGLGLWSFRDANWSPDFPTSAQTAIRLYHLTQNHKVEGVIAVEQTTVRLILEALEPVTVPGTSEPVSAENIVDLMRQSWSVQPGERADNEWKDHRKDLMIALGQKLLERLQTSHDLSTWAALAQQVLTALDQRHLLIYSTQPPLAARLAEAGWDGGLQPGSHDFLMVVDANVGYDRVNPLIQESLHYTVDLSNPARPTAFLVVRYFNTTPVEAACRQPPEARRGEYIDSMQQCYWDYWRVLAPAGITLLYASPNHVSADELITRQGDTTSPRARAGDVGTTEISGIFVLPPNQSEEIRLIYELPPSVLEVSGSSEITYRLHLQKQSGIDSLPVNLTLTYPAAWQVKDSSIPSSGQPPGELHSETKLLSDLDLEVTFSQTP